MNIVLAGGTGFIGGALVDALIARGDRPTLLTRDPEAAQARWSGKCGVALWDGRAADLKAQAKGPVQASVEMNATRAPSGDQRGMSSRCVEGARYSSGVCSSV